MALFVIWVIVCMRAFPLKALGYNPLSASCDDRLTDTIAEANSFDVILPAGTTVKRSDVYTSAVKLGHQVISAGYVESVYSNRSCGVAVILGNRLKKARIYDPVVASGKLGGRGLAGRAANGFADVTAIPVYFPPCPRQKSQFAIYRQTCRELAS